MQNYAIVFFHDRANEWMIERSVATSPETAFNEMFDPDGEAEGISWSSPQDGVTDFVDSSGILNARILDESVLRPIEVQLLTCRYMRS